ncbi:MAG TPA: hypothetical protein VFN25_11275 [Dokdonella sp.]|uniref:hypothetical protein n=1 Tax=Dokdonella sp. TaxID=2291710 RepID=UPI002D807897|nr:hypothetical protein [Dokdonella sp.]HET9033474.1 hypothetical protein [Dokdonella sp.]
MTTLKVTLDESTTPWTVNVNQSGNANHVPHGAKAHTITWRLSGNAKTGFFVPLSDPEPGFSWFRTKPSEGIFSDMAIRGNGKKLTVNDTNDNASSKGEWTYVMRVNVGGTVYSTIAVATIATNTNPTIRNN